MKKKPKPAKVQTSFRLSRDAYDLMQRLAAHMGVGRGAVLEIAIREFAHAQGVK